MEAIYFVPPMRVPLSKNGVELRFAWKVNLCGTLFHIVMYT